MYLFRPIYDTVYYEEGRIYFDLSMLKFRLENTGLLCYPNFVSVHFDLFIDIYDQAEYGDYFVINRGICKLATIEIKKIKTFNN